MLFQDRHRTVGILKSPPEKKSPPAAAPATEAQP